MHSCVTILLALVVSLSARAQDSVNYFRPAVEFKKNRFIASLGLQTAGYGGSLALLSSAWYKDYNHTPLHSFDDRREWLQVDKAGHLVTSWYLARMNMDMLLWSGVAKKKAIWYGAAGSFLYLSGIEVLDGLSDGWGFSWSDMAANVFGTALMIRQKQKYFSTTTRTKTVNGCVTRYTGRSWLTGLSLKYSFHQTGFADMRPELLGDNFQEQMIKDYNGHTYWLSFNISSVMWEEKKFPKWLNVSFGYGGEGMISGHPGFVTLQDGTTLWMERYRQYYLSLDIDLSRIRTRSKILKTVFETFSFLKIPAPALELNKNGIKFYSLYY